MFVFANQELSRVNGQLIQMNADLERSKAAIILARPSITGTNQRWKIDNVLITDSAYSDITDKVTVLKIQRETLQSLVVNYEKLMNALSRELSRKISEREKGGVFST